MVYKPGRKLSLKRSMFWSHSRLETYAGSTVSLVSLLCSKHINDVNLSSQYRWVLSKKNVRLRLVACMKKVLNNKFPTWLD